MPASRKTGDRNNCFSLQPLHQVTRETATSAVCTVLLVSQKRETSAPDIVDLNLSPGYEVWLPGYPGICGLGYVEDWKLFQVRQRKTTLFLLEDFKIFSG